MNTKYGISLMFDGMTQQEVLAFLDSVIQLYEDTCDGSMMLSTLHAVQTPQEAANDPE